MCHDGYGRVVPHWHNGALAGCGSLLSTIEDLALFVQAELEPPTSALPETIELSQRRLPGPDTGGRAMGFGWLMDSLSGITTLWHNGATSGFSSYLAVQPERSRGIVLLCNRAPREGYSIEAQGRQLLRAEGSWQAETSN